jgi:hypothetical protein
MQLVSAILYNRYNSRHTTTIKDRQRGLFIYIWGPNTPNYPIVAVNQWLN